MVRYTSRFTPYVNSKKLNPTQLQDSRLLQEVGNLTTRVLVVPSLPIPTYLPHTDIF